jgi:hypothetical protein
LVQIRDLNFHRYLVAGDNYDGKVYHLVDYKRPNAVWAFVQGDPQATFYRLIDLRHGMHLLNRPFPANPNLPLPPDLKKDLEEHVGHSQINENPFDNRAKWTRSQKGNGSDDPQNTYALLDGFEQKLLYANGTIGDGIRLSREMGSKLLNPPQGFVLLNNQKWEFVDAALMDTAAPFGYFLYPPYPPRLPITDGNMTIRYQVDTSGIPELLKPDAALAVVRSAINDAVQKWSTRLTRWVV